MNPSNLWRWLVAVTLAVALLLPGPASAAMRCDGTDDLINFGNETALNGIAEITASFWVFREASGTTKRIISKVSGTTYTLAITGESTERLGFITDGSGGNASITVNNALPQGVWVHVAARYNGNGNGNAGRHQVWIDGVFQALVYTGTIAATPSSTSAEMGYCGNPTTANENFNGQLANVKVWTAALSEEEIFTEMFTYAPVRRANLLMWHTLDNTSPLNYDLSGNGKHGTLSGAPVYTPGYPPVTYGGN